MASDIVPAIELRHVTKRFGNRNVLDDLTLSIPARQGLCLLGRSGTGKSVTLRHVIGLMRPDSGRVFVNDDEVSALDSTRAARATYEADKAGQRTHLAPSEASPQKDEES